MPLPTMLIRVDLLKAHNYYYLHYGILIILL